MSSVSQEQLLEAGCHFGHLTRKWNPKMAPYIFMEQDGIHIIDLHKTAVKLEEAGAAIKSMVKSGRKILFVATKKQAKDIIKEAAAQTAMPFAVERWLGGMLTNFATVRKSIKKMQTIDKMAVDGTYANINKKEKLMLEREKAKLSKVLGGIANMSRIPAALFLVDIGHEHIALAEAKRLGVTTFGVVDTNCDPNKVDFFIPGNDDATKSIAIIVNYIVAAIAEGLAERQAEKDEDDSSSDSEESAEAKAARFEQKADSGDDRNKRAKGAAPTKRRIAGPGAGGRKPAGGGAAGPHGRAGCLANARSHRRTNLETRGGSTPCPSKLTAHCNCWTEHARVTAFRMPT